MGSRMGNHRMFVEKLRKCPIERPCARQNMMKMPFQCPFYVLVPFWIFSTTGPQTSWVSLCTKTVDMGGMIYSYVSVGVWLVSCIFPFILFQSNKSYVFDLDTKHLSLQVLLIFSPLPTETDSLPWLTRPKGMFATKSTTKLFCAVNLVAPKKSVGYFSHYLISQPTTVKLFPPQTLVGVSTDIRMEKVCFFSLFFFFFTWKRDDMFIDPHSTAPCSRVDPCLNNSWSQTLHSTFIYSLVFAARSNIMLCFHS